MSEAHSGDERRWGLTDTVFGPGLGEGLAGSDGVERRCGFTGTLLLGITHLWGLLMETTSAIFLLCYY